MAVRAGRVLLLKNEREEWELPGGRRAMDRVLRDDYLRGLKRGLGSAGSISSR